MSVTAPEKNAPRLVLAPMEGLTDVHMRDVLTRIGGYDWCVTEFIRITDRLMPARTFFEFCPELRNGGKTQAGTPVHVQLLGSEPAVLAENAARAAELGAPAIDLNFGCPAKTVNKHRGGAVLLDEPEVVHAIVAAVRRAVPAYIPVTAKMRLGVNDRLHMLENAQGIAAAGADWLTVHARTKADGYRPPAHWEALAEIKQAVKIPLIANGEIWTVDDALKCRAVSACADLMIGRGAVTRPDLLRRIRGEDLILSWAELVSWQQEFLRHMATAMQQTGQRNLSWPEAESQKAKWSESGAVGRYKQWLAMLTAAYPQARQLFADVKRLRRLQEVEQALQASLAPGYSAEN